MTEFKPMSGGCQCGTVRYEVRAPTVDLYHCHCSMCRKVHGAAFATLAIAPKESVVFVQGEENLTRFDSSEGVSRFFCKTCGCQMTIDVADDPGLRWFTPGTLDDGTPPGAADKERHIFVGSKAKWFEIADDLPQFEERPPDTWEN